MPLKHVIFMNPMRRRIRSRSRTRRSHRRVYRNPHHLSAAHKLKISRALRRRGSKGSARRSFPARTRRIRRIKSSLVSRRIRRVTKTVVRYRSRAHRAMRRSFRRSSRRSGFGSLSLRSILSKDNLMLGAGVVGSTVVTTWVLQNYGAKLPGITNTWGRVAYQVGIPVAGAYLLKRVSPQLAKGMLVGGIAAGIISLMQTAQVGLPGISVAGTGAYLGQSRRRVGGASGFLTGTPAGSRVGTPSVQALNTFGASTGGIYDSAPAFKSAWTR